MADLVQTRRDGNVAVISIDNPPVNALSQAVRADLLDALVAAKADAACAAVVILCAGRTFIAGADISEFGKPPRSPTTIDVIAAIEALGRPVVAAMHGTALGGGLELALGCHARVAAPTTRLGQPEIKLGLIPGAGGSQRLPRLVGVELALTMIVGGDPIGAEEAHASGLIDAIIDGDLAAGAIDFARRLAAAPAPPVLARERDDKLAAARADRAPFEELASRLTRRSRGLEAPAAAVEAVRWSLDLPVAEALARERATFLRLVAGEQARAQRHLFFAEREAAKSPAIAGVTPRAVRQAAVIGAGTMGGGIAMCFANAGIVVSVIDVSLDALTRGLDLVAANYRASVARGTLAPADMEQRLALIRGATALPAIADADIVIEAAFEDMEVKRGIFADIDRHAPAHALLATNTSYLDVDAIARATQRPKSVLGMHFFSPAQVMRLVEIVRGAQTAPEALATAVALARRIGKAPAIVGVCHGFVGNRMHRLRSVEAERLMLEGALPQDIDAAMTEFGFPMGPIAASDLAGLDIGWRMRKAQGLRAEIADLLCEAGRFGQKTGMGFYRYAAGARDAKPDPQVERLIIDASARLGVARRAIGAEEIVERVLFPMINEGARILEEKIAQRPGDIDVIWVHGYAFPAWRGGPMHYADTLGRGHVRARLAPDRTIHRLGTGFC
ncbi:MAG: enoyl-CoA hydratase/isomerase family protein [Proteobacteria bacterium]|nr:enoyl-CoA hydratase/isomerase family protein [Pseudomonadota bacterium]